VSWELSSSLSNDFCIEAFERAVKKYDKPTIFNTDQGVQFTSDNFTASILDKGICIKYGWKRESYRQCIYGTFKEEFKVRRSIFKRL
jgi:transposase InsO family protein